MTLDYILLLLSLLCGALAATEADSGGHIFFNDDNASNDGRIINEANGNGVDKDVDESIEKRVNDAINARVDLGVGQRVNEILNSKVVTNIIQQRINDLVEKGFNDLVETRVNNLVKTRWNDLVKNFANQMEERMVNIIEAHINVKFEKHITDKPNAVVKDNVNEVLEEIASNDQSHDNPVVKDENMTLTKQNQIKEQSKIQHTAAVPLAKHRRLLVDGVPDGSNVGPVGFTACVSVPDLKELGAHHTIKFDNEITNVGAAYHHNTGIFTAPARGLYVFHLAAMVVPHKSQYLHLMRDGQYVAPAYPSSLNDATATSGHLWLLELNAGSEVWIETKTSGELHGNCYTVLSGFLLNAM